MLAVCDDFGVIVLHGPPHLPRFYGQLECQNREHRDWLQIVEIACPVELDDELELMRTRLNEFEPRRSLDWKTAAERWKHRGDFGSRNAPKRLKFSSDVDRHTDSILRDLDDATRASHTGSPSRPHSSNVAYSVRAEQGGAKQFRGAKALTKSGASQASREQEHLRETASRERGGRMTKRRTTNDERRTTNDELRWRTCQVLSVRLQEGEVNGCFGQPSP